MRQFKDMTEGEKIVESIFGLVLGTIFIFGMGHWNAPVTRAEARDITATFSSFQESKKRGEVREIILRFDDHEQLYIDRLCINEALCGEIEALAPHTVVRLLVHPNSNTVLEMTAGETTLLNLEESVEKLSGEVYGFRALGCVCYVLAIGGLVQIIMSNRKK